LAREFIAKNGWHDPRALTDIVWPGWRFVDQKNPGNPRWGTVVCQNRDTAAAFWYRAETEPQIR